MSHIAVIGAGLVGRGWSVVFARGGRDVVLFDSNEEALARARQSISATLEELDANGLLDEPTSTIFGRIQTSGSLEEALSGAIHAQENVPETETAKRELFSQMDSLAAPDTVLASSTSGIPASRFTETLAHRGRCLVAHPINPPSLVPLVELIPAPWTDADAVQKTHRLMEDVGQSPITLHREIPGFVVNRLQGALLNEALALIQDGYLEVDDLDRAIRDGLGARWFFMGPIETIDLNAPGGVRDYLERYGPMYRQVAESAHPRDYDEALLSQLEQARRERLPVEAREERMAWRDRYLAELAALRKRRQ